MSKVRVPQNPNDCWEWQGVKQGAGYGCFRIDRSMHQAHRISYQHFNGVDPEKLFVCHACDNRKCVNPHHLFTGTNTDNMRDMINKERDLKSLTYVNRHKTHCKRGHEFTEENTYLIPKGRSCKMCMRLHSKKYRSKNEHSKN